MTPKSAQSKDARTLADNNPCGICRAMGLPICKGHGRGSSGSADSSNSEKSTLDSASAAGPDLAASLAKSPAWTPLDDLEFTSQNPNALFSVKLDVGSGSLVFSGRKNLTKEEQAVLDEYFKAIGKEFNDFKTELAAQGVDVQGMQMTREGNNLTIKIPTPKYFDVFVQRLIEKNLLATQLGDLPQSKPYDTELDTLSARPGRMEEGSRSTAPTPFDMDGPKPKD